MNFSKSSHQLDDQPRRHIFRSWQKGHRSLHVSSGQTQPKAHSPLQQWREERLTRSQSLGTRKMPTPVHPENAPSASRSRRLSDGKLPMAQSRSWSSKWLSRLSDFTAVSMMADFRYSNGWHDSRSDFINHATANYYLRDGGMVRYHVYQ